MNLLCAVPHERLGAFHQLIRRHIFEMLAETPAIAEGVADHGGAFAPELILGSSQRGGASGESTGESFVAVIDLYGKHTGGQSAIWDGEGVGRRSLIGDVDVCGADHKLRMRHDARRWREAKQLHGTQGPGVEVERIGCAFAGEGEGDGGFVGLAHGWVLEWVI